MDEILTRFHDRNSSFSMLDKLNKNSNFALEELPSDDSDYILIKNCFENTMDVTNLVKTYKIYRVNKLDESDETSEEKTANLLLFHGTNLESAVGILDTDFKPSAEGAYGPGVYLTESSLCAMVASRQKVGLVSLNDYLNIDTLDINAQNKKIHFIFVNEVLQSEKLERKIVEDRPTEKTDTPRQYQFEKHIKKGTTLKNSEKDYKNDSCGRKS